MAHEMGASNKAITRLRLIGLDTSVVSRRLESGSTRMRHSSELQQLVKEIRTLVFKVGSKISRELQNCRPGPIP